MIKKINEINFDDVPGIKDSSKLLAKALIRKFYVNPLKKVKNNLLWKKIRIKFFNKPIKLYVGTIYGKITNNFGDNLNIDIVKNIFKKKIIVKHNRLDLDMFGIGSTITASEKEGLPDYDIYFWGSGLFDKMKVKNSNFKFCSCRGDLTRKCLPEKYRNIPLGDPGLLVNLVFKENVKNVGLIGIIPHGLELDSNLLKKAKSNPKKYMIISPLDSPKNVIKKMKKCKVILSSSLHGLICADSFSIPNIHVVLNSNNDLTPMFKYDDYYSAIGKKHKLFSNKDIYNDKSIEKVIDEYKPIKDLETIQQKIIDAFPYK